MERAFTIAFAILCGLVLVWLVLVKVLFRRLQRGHPAKYKAMGEPSLLWNNSAKTGWAMLRFLFRREHKELGDPVLSRLSDFMLVFVCAYVALFVAIIVGVLLFVPVGNTT